MSVSLKDPNRFDENPAVEKVKALLQSKETNRTLKHVAPWIYSIQLILFLLGFSFFMFKDADPLDQPRNMKTVSVNIVRMDPPAYKHYRLITDSGKMLNYDNEPETFAELISRGFPLKTEVIVNQKGIPVVPSKMSSLVPGIFLAVLVFAVLIVTDCYRTPKDSPRQKRRLIRNGLVVQCVLMIAGNLLIPQWDFWSPWLLLGLGPIAVNIASLSKRKWLPAAIGILLLMIYPCFTVIQILDLKLGHPESVVAKKVFAHYGFEEREIRTRKHGSWSYMVQVCSVLFTYTWHDKPRYYYVELEDYVDDGVKGNSPEGYQQDCAYINLLSSNTFPLCVRNSGGVPHAYLPKPIRREKEVRKTQLIYSINCIVFALFIVFALSVWWIHGKKSEKS